MDNSVEDNRPVRLQAVYFLIDLAGDKKDQHITEVNALIKNIISQLPNKYEIKDAFGIAIRLSGDRWFHDERITVPVSEYEWEDLSLNDCANSSDMLLDLNLALTPEAFKRANAHLTWNPFIIFITDHSSNAFQREKSISALKRNKYYQRAAKIAIAFSDEAIPCLTNLAENSELVWPFPIDVHLENFLISDIKRSGLDEYYEWSDDLSENF